jgi:hypothetical protein
VNKYPIKIDWEWEIRGGRPWNEVCTVIVEKFGLPGDKYTTELSNHYMIFNFNEPEDALMAKLTIGDTGGGNA